MVFAIKSFLYRLQNRFAFCLIVLLLAFPHFLSAENPSVTKSGLQEKVKTANPILQYKESKLYLNSFENNSLSEIRKSNLQFHTYPFLAFFLIILMLAFIKISSPDFFKELMNSFMVSRAKSSSAAGKRISLRLSNIFIDCSKMLVLSLLFYEIINQFSEIRYYEVLLALSGFTLLKLLITLPFYSIFFGYEKSNIQVRNVFLFNRIMFLFILPCVFVAEFCPPDYKTAIIWFSAIIVVVFLLLRTILIFVQLKNTYNYNYFYILLYVSIFEISLFFVVYKEFSLII